MATSLKKVEEEDGEKITYLRRGVLLGPDIYGELAFS